MAAYFISFRDTMKDAARYAAYLEKAGPSLAGHPARLVVANGALTPLEGACPDGVVIIEFPDVAAARAWYDSPAYQAAIGERLAATEGRAVIVEGPPTA
jgi:uncharacterized protein (DUF1330 family)